MKNISIYKRYSPAVSPGRENNNPAWMFIFSSNKILVKNENEGLKIPKSREINIELKNKQYLGEFDGAPCYCAETVIEEGTQDNMSFMDLRSILGAVEEDVSLLAGRAFQIVNWNRMNKFCGKCGSLTKNKDEERAKICPECGAVFYPRISPAIIVAIVHGDKILLASNKNFRQNWYSVVAGFVEPGETFEDCVNREVMEEVGIKIKNIKYFGSQPWPFPDSLMVGFTAEYDSGEIKVDGIEIGDAKWFSVENIPPRPNKVSIAGHLIDWFIENYS